MSRMLRLAQRIPIRVELDDVPCPVVLSAGVTATVSVQSAPAGRTGPHSRETWTGAQAAQACAPNQPGN